MKQFIFLVSTCVMTIGCVSESQVLTVKNPFKTTANQAQTNGDPFQAAAAMPQQRPLPQTDVPVRRAGYAAVMNNASYPANPQVPGKARPGWSTTRYAPALTPQGGSVPQDNVQLTFRAASSLPESQTRVVSAAAAPEQTTDIPGIGNSVSRQSAGEDPFLQGNVTNADFTETDETNITQLGAVQPSQASPATLEQPVFIEDDEQGDPFSKAPSQPAKESNEWWQQ